jgi:hypothetical protein
LRGTPPIPLVGVVTCLAVRASDALAFSQLYVDRSQVISRAVAAA